jgi:hypothetical protein
MPVVQLCPHGTNPKACPTCFRIQPPPPKPADGLPPGVVRPGIPLGNVVSMADAVLNASRVAAQRAPNIKRADGSTVTMKEPYSSANRAPPPEAYDPSKPWIPPEHAEVADRVPVHPHRDEGKAEYRGPVFVPVDPTTIKAAK